MIRTEQPSDAEAIGDLLRSAFNGQDEAHLVAGLREAGDLALSLVAEAEKTIIGHIALSPIGGDVQALALAPLAVSPKARNRGVGAALIHAVLAWAGTTPVVVLGEPAYYRRFDFRPAQLDSPYAGPYLQVHGTIPAGSRITHSPVFAGL